MMLLRLFWEFFKIGLFAVGGGMATIPFLYDLSDRTGWFTYTQLADMIAISESTPGPIGVNMATYVGYEMSGVLGSKRLLRAAAGFLRADCLGSALGSHCGTAGRWLELWYPVAEHPLAGGGAGGVFGHCDQPKADQKVAPYCVPGLFRCGGHCVSLCGGVKRRLPKVFCRAAGRKMWLLYCI